ncbi:MAG: twin-arginine translocase TatA/TatE family subunit [Gammaproteobacteria bacterium]|nr:twin-arginine translocase TatA/TatE family subunit [Gammaproteobacteria bacterium]
MGFGIKELVVVLLIAVVIFGTTRLKTIGADLGSAIKGFRKAMTGGEEEEEKEKDDSKASISDDSEEVIEGEVQRSAERRDV